MFNIFSFKKKRKIQTIRGMTYVELIVVMSVFSIVSTAVLFSHKNFQGRVDLRNLANDLAIRFVEAQKSALAGKLAGGAGATWKPSYGIYFNLVSPGNTTSFIYFADLDADKKYNTTDLNFCTNPSTPNDECLDKIAILKGSYVSEIRIFYNNSTNSTVNNLATTFTRPNSGAVFASGGSTLSGVSYAQVTLTSPSVSSPVRVVVYSAGRIEIN